MSEEYKIDWNGDEYNIADDKMKVAAAIQIWSWHQQRPTSVAEAARVFNIAPAHVIEAIEEYDSPYLFLSAPIDDYAKMMIEHEGE